MLRPNIASLKPYTSARDEYQGKDAKIFLDANENPYNTPYNRYPDPLQRDLKAQVAAIKGVRPTQIFMGNGSDEGIDLMYRLFCTPGKDNVVAIEPTYGMYGVTANINDVEYRPVLLDENFQPCADKILAAVDCNTKVIWFCSPNNPSGNDIDHSVIEKVLDSFDGIVVVDEAYIDFSDQPSFLQQLDKYPNMVVLQTFSKAWGLAGLRLGMAFASEEIIQTMNKVKYPYNVNMLTQQTALDELGKQEQIEQWVKETLIERNRLMQVFQTVKGCLKVYPSNANFFLARFENATDTYNYLVDNGIIVRNRSKIALCGNSLRVTIGTPAENDQLVECLNRMK